MATAKGSKAGDKPLHFNLEVVGYEGDGWKGGKESFNPPIVVRVTGRGVRGILSGLAYVHDDKPGNWMVHGHDALKVSLKGDGRYSFMMGTGSIHSLAEANVDGLSSKHVRDCAENWAKDHPLALEEHVLNEALAKLNKAEASTAWAKTQLGKAETYERECDQRLADAKHALAVAQATMGNK